MALNSNNNILDKHTNYMLKAIDLAEKAAIKDEVPVGAILVFKDKIISKFHNKTEVTTSCIAHAELLCINHAQKKLKSKYLNECTLYVTIEPCPMCAAALYWAKLGTLVYGASDTKRGYTLFKPVLVHPKTSIIQGIEQEKCGNLMTTFFRKKRIK